LLPGSSIAVFLALGSAHAQDPAPPAAAPTDAPAAPEPPPLLKSPELVQFVEAPYPEDAFAQGLEGKVTLLLDVDETGRVTNAQVLAPAGHGFDEAAVAAALQFQFSPAEDETGPVPVQLEFEYGFEKKQEEVVADPVATTNLDGQLLEMGTRRPLASFQIAVDGLGLTATTDAEGRFSFAGVPPGTVAVVVAHPGYESIRKEVAVTSTELTSLKLWVRNLSYKDEDIVGVYKREQEDVTRRTLSITEVRQVPGTFGDPVRVIQSLPGAARASFGSGVLVIRGANPEDSALYVDGIRVPIIYHLGGFESVVSADLIDAVDYLPGGYGVRYGRSTGGVVDVRTKAEFPERHKVIWSTDLLDSSAVIAGRVGKNASVGYAVAGRRSYIDVFIPFFTGDTGFYVKPRWYDYQLKVARQNGPEDGELSAFLFGFDDVLRVGTPDDFAQGTDQDTQGDLALEYASHRLVTRWKTRLGDDATFELSPSFGVDTITFNLGSSFDFHIRNWILQTRAEVRWQLSDAFQLRPGVDLWTGPYDVGITLPFVPTYELDPLAERQEFDFEASGLVVSAEPFVDLAIQPFPHAKRKWTITPGVRFDNAYVTFEGGNSFLITAVDPRLSSRAEITERGTLKLGTGLFHQPPQGPDFGFNDNAIPGFERAWSSEIGWEQQFTDAIEGDVTVFYKALDDLIVENLDYGGPEDPTQVNEGLGRAMGVEVILRHSLVDKLFGWVSYTLSKSDRMDHPDEPDAEWVPYSYDQTHILTAVAGYRLPRDFEVSTKIQYVTGNPYTPYDGGVYDADQDTYVPYSIGDPNSSRLPPFTEVDFRVNKLFTFKSWQLEVYVDFLNAIHGVNPEGIQYNYDYTEHTYTKGLPFIPSPGFQAEFEF
jgi:TonB family protein